MPEGYTRSRAKQYRDYPEDDGYRGPGGGGGNNTVKYVVIGVVAVVLLCVIGFGARAIVLTFKNNGASTTAPADTASVVDTASPEDTSSMSPDDTATANPDDTTSANPDDTTSANPDDTSSTSPDDTTSANPDDTSTAAPDDTATTSPDDTTPPDTNTSGTFTAVEVKGSANVQEYLPLRSSASSTSTLVTKIQKDEEFTILAVSKTATWLKVKYNDKTGYVLAKYVTIGGDSSYKVCTITSASVNVREGAGKTKNLLGKLTSGSTVIVEKKVSVTGGTWYKIKSGDSVGYIDSRYARISIS